MTERTLITAALIYANGPVHLGHLVEYIQTDIYTRFLKMKGQNAIYCCADDTHGTPIEISAMKAGITPEEFIKKWHAQHTKDFSDFLIDFDSYYTTHSKENEKYTNLIFERLKEKGHIYKKILKQLYCENCKRFLPDRFVKGICPKCGAEHQYGDVCESCGATYKPVDLKNPYCAICEGKPVMKDSDHYFFRLSNFFDQIRKWLEGNENLQKDIKNYVLSWVDKGLEDWCVSRDSPYFGFKIPGEKDKYFYVWLDAPIGYIASTENYCKGKSCSAEDYWNPKNKSKIIHFIGKDIAYFHLIFWPAVLMGAGFQVPNNVVVHGFLTIDKKKMSKSRGTFITAQEYLEKLNPELLRYHYAANLAKNTSDIDLSFEDFRNKINGELIGNISNFCYRTLSFVGKYGNGMVRQIGTKRNDLSTIEEVNEKIRDIDKAYQNFTFRDVVKGLLEISDIGNRYFQENAPWELAKNDKDRMNTVLAVAVNIVKKLAIVSKPILPESSEKLEKQLGFNELKWDDLYEEVENKKIGKPEILFERIGEITFSEPFASLDLKVAKVEKVKDHPEAEKLYVLDVSLGKEKRTIVAGLKAHYKRKEIEGKNIIIVANMKPAKLRGIVSEGMLLAADDGKNVGILIPNGEPGTDVTAEGVVKRPVKEVDIKDILKLKIHSKKGKVLYNEKILQTDNGKVTVDKNIEGTVR